MAYVITDDCMACGACAANCPVEAISEGDKYVIDADTCIDCGNCANVCPYGAISYEENEYSGTLPVRKEDSHKGTYGRLLVIAGSKGMSGPAKIGKNTTKSINNFSMFSSPFL